MKISVGVSVMAKQENHLFPAISLADSGLVFKLSRAELLILFALYRECSKSGHRVWRRVTTKKLRDITGCSQPTVVNGLSGLERHLLIERQREGPGTKKASKYRINWQAVTRLENRSLKAS